MTVSVVEIRVTAEHGTYPITVPYGFEGPSGLIYDSDNEDFIIVGINAADDDPNGAWDATVHVVVAGEGVPTYPFSSRGYCGSAYVPSQVLNYDPPVFHVFIDVAWGVFPE